MEEQAQIIARAVGGRGPNAEYLFNTAAHLAEIGLADPDLDWLAARVREIGNATP
jgi:cation transport protein ChaC